MNFMRFNRDRAKGKVLHLGWGSLQDYCRLGGSPLEDLVAAGG